MRNRFAGWILLAMLGVFSGVIGCGASSDFAAGASSDSTAGALSDSAADTSLGLSAGVSADSTDSTSLGYAASAPSGGAATWNEMTPVSSTPLSYATQFSIDCYEGGYRLLSIGGGEGKAEGAGDAYLIIPPGSAVPEGLPSDITVICQPISHLYLAATSAMDLIRSLDQVDAVTLSGTDRSGWYIEEAKKALEDGRMTYAGKYSAPDYELILSEGCDLAVESTMIYHSPEVKEQLERLGIPVLVERSSYESHPLGRMEWLKLYGALFGKEEEAQAIFEQEEEKLTALLKREQAGESDGETEEGNLISRKTAAFFYIGSNGQVNVRKSGDYVVKMIELAGGSYVPEGLQDNGNALSTMNMQMEAFYAAAREAGVLIYNSTIDGELETISDLLKKSSLLADFKAVKEGNVWCTEKNLFQETMGLGDMILDLHAIFTGEAGDRLTYMHRLK